MSDQIKYEDAVTPQEEATGFDMPEEFDADGNPVPEAPELPDEPMSTEEKQTEAARLINDAKSFNESNLAPHRAQATDYYFGRPFGDEEEGRSQVVSTELKDTVDAMMPSFMRLFFGPDRVVEFEPRSAEDTDNAEQATDYINYVIEQDNNGVVEIHNAIKDAALRRMGVVKYWWDDTTEVENHEFNGLTEDQLLLLEADPRIEYTIVSKEQYTDPVQLQQYSQMRQAYDAALQQGPEAAAQMQPPQMPQPITLCDVEVKYTNPDGRCRFGAVPPEEWLFSSDARNVADSTLVGQVQDKTLSDLRVMGIPDDILLELSTSSATGGARTTDLQSTQDAIARTPEGGITSSEASGANQKIPYYEIYVYMDVDNDGVTEHRKMVLVGHEPKLVWDDPAPERPFAVFELDPEPHTMVGMDVADRVMDLQLTKSKVLRGSLDSLAFSLHPRTVAVEGEASIADIMNTEIGAVIRERAPGMVRTLQHDFVGQYALPYLQYLDEMKQSRVGVVSSAAGLDPNALQSSTQTAVAATVTGSQQRLELYARMLAETGMKQLMRGILRTVVANQDAPRHMRLRNQHVTVDPRVWDATMDLRINVAVGYTVVEERIAALTAISGKQAEIIAQMGPGNPFVTYGQYAQSLQKITELSGFKDTTRYFKPLPVEFDAPPPEPKPSPEEVLAQAQAQKVQADAEIDKAELELKRAEIAAREERERDRISADVYLRAKEIELKYKTKLDENEIKAAAAAQRKVTNE
jgi:hypothetical protein